MFESIGVIVAGVIGVIAVLYLVIFMIAPKTEIKRVVDEPVSKLPLPELNPRAKKIVEHTLGYFYRKEKIDLRKYPLGLRRLHDAALKAEKELEASESYLLRIPTITTDDYGGTNLEITIYRDLLDGGRKKR
ncbi:MAG: Hsp70 family protein [Candidatus Eremiobacteraeota bacterium]|nr:Hsp70 family protein [Candidatus Eremiobacteraeota bacterium]